MAKQAIAYTSSNDRNNIDETDWQNHSSKNLRNDGHFCGWVGESLSFRQCQTESECDASISTDYSNAFIRQVQCKKEQDDKLHHPKFPAFCDLVVNRYANFSDGISPIPQMTAMNVENKRQEVNKQKFKTSRPSKENSITPNVKQQSAIVRPPNSKYTSGHKEVKTAQDKRNMQKSISNSKPRKPLSTQNIQSKILVPTKTQIHRGMKDYQNNINKERVTSPTRKAVPTLVNNGNGHQVGKERNSASVPGYVQNFNKYPKVKESSVIVAPTEPFYTSPPPKMLTPVYINTPISERSFLPDDLAIKNRTSQDIQSSNPNTESLGFGEDCYRNKFSSVGRNVGEIVGDVVRDGVASVGGFVGTLIGEGSDRFIHFMTSPKKAQQDISELDEQPQIVGLSENAGNALGNACGNVFHAVGELIEAPETVLKPKLMHLKERMEDLPLQTASDTWLGDPNICYNDEYTKPIMPPMGDVFGDREGLLDAMDVLVTVDNAQRAAASIHRIVKETIPEVQEKSAKALEFAKEESAKALRFASESIDSAKSQLPPLVDVGKSLDGVVNKVGKSLGGFSDTACRSLNGFGSSFMQGFSKTDKPLEPVLLEDDNISGKETRTQSRSCRPSFDDSYQSWRRKN